MLECLLVGMAGGGGEELFVRDLAADPPPGVRYALALRHHESVPGARPRRVAEILFNRLVHPWIWPLTGLRAYRVDQRFDVVHVHNYAHCVSSPHRVPVVMSLGGGSYYHYVRDYLGWPDERVRALYRRAAVVFRAFGITNEFVAWRRLRGIFVRSAFAKSYLVRMGVPERLVEVIPPGFPTPSLPARPPEPEGFTFLFVGRDRVRKGADLFIAAVRALRSQGLNVRAVVAGDPSFRELAGEDGFEAHPWVDRSVLYRELYPRADALVLPSRAEGFGMAPIEAMSFALPVIATRYGAFPETVIEGQTGLLVPAADGAAVRRAMAELAADPRRAREMGAAGRSRFEGEYTRERFLARVRAFYDRALGAG
ncbi:MAG: glycosyltransferase family 4 protein [Gemmatimonadetes bacterium]|nr:glycosyltransferase family 4 protein [Gemmatimonadota bacterium]